MLTKLSNLLHYWMFLRKWVFYISLIGVFGFSIYALYINDFCGFVFIDVSNDFLLYFHQNFIVYILPAIGLDVSLYNSIIIFFNLILIICLFFLYLIKKRFLIPFFSLFYGSILKAIFSFKNGDHVFFNFFDVIKFNQLTTLKDKETIFSILKEQITLIKPTIKDITFSDILPVINDINDPQHIKDSILLYFNTASIQKEKIDSNIGSLHSISSFISNHSEEIIIGFAIVVFAGFFIFYLSNYTSSSLDVKRLDDLESRIKNLENNSSSQNIDVSSVDGLKSSIKNTSHTLDQKIEGLRSATTNNFEHVLQEQAQLEDLVEELQTNVTNNALALTEFEAKRVAIDRIFFQGINQQGNKIKKLVEILEPFVDEDPKIAAVVKVLR